MHAHSTPTLPMFHFARSAAPAAEVSAEASALEGHHRVKVREPVRVQRQTSPLAVRQHLLHGGRRPTVDEKQRADYRHRATFAVPVPARLFGPAERPVVQLVDPAAARAREAVGNGEAALLRGVLPGADNPEAQRQRAVRRRHFYQGLYALHQRSVVRPSRFSNSLGSRLSLVEE